MDATSILCPSRRTVRATRTPAPLYFILAALLSIAQSFAQKSWMPAGVPTDDLGRVVYPNLPRPPAAPQGARTISTPAEVLAIRTYAKDANGWLVVTDSADTRSIYVSPQGADANDGLSALKPKKTAAAGVKLLRDGFADHLYFACGGTWLDEQINLSGLRGRSPAEPLVVGSYGTGARPRFLGMTKPGVQWSFTGTQGEFANVVILGLELESSMDASFWVSGGSRFPGVNVITNGPFSYLHIEDCVIRGFAGPILIQPYSPNFRDVPLGKTLRIVRNYLVDPNVIGPQDGAACAYLREIAGVLGEGNWAGAHEAHIAAGFNPPSEGFYICESAPFTQANTCTRDVVVMGNAFYNCNTGIQDRSGPSYVVSNYTIGCSMHINFGIGYFTHVGWVFCSGNLGQDAKYATNINGSGTVPVGWFIHSMADGYTQIEGNYCRNLGIGRNPRAFSSEKAATAALQWNVAESWEPFIAADTVETARVDDATKILYGGNSTIVFGSNVKTSLIAVNGCPVTTTAPNPVIRPSGSKPAAANVESFLDMAIRLNRRGGKYLFDPVNYCTTGGAIVTTPAVSNN